MLTLAQRQFLHADAIAQPDLIDALANADDTFIADFYNAIPTPAYVVWKTKVDKGAYQNSVSSDSTVFSWAGTGGYIARSQGERDAWRALFEPNGIVDPSKANVITAFNDIFSGTGAQAVNNRLHLSSMSKRSATLAEKLLSTGTGTSENPAVLGYEGVISSLEASQIRVNE